MIVGRRGTPHSSGPKDLPYPFLSAITRGPRGHRTRQIQDAIRAAIVNLALPPGEFIRQSAICARLRVSLGPVIEALDNLAAEGFVEIVPHRGTRVCRIDITACRQAMLVRRALEGEAMRLLAPRADRRLIARLEDNLRHQDVAVKQADATGFARRDFAFHDLLLSELGYRRVQGVVESARAKLDRARDFLLREPERRLRNYLDHLAIVDALKRHDAAAAQRAMTRHIDTAMREIETRGAENPEMFAPPSDIERVSERWQLRLVS
ncbi:MAG TPA: GntR family transcriptional regulator [Xanthobacteraceae bacterium]|nr:GntR family transcriptional regulator [Xanthobacteraceae bacterium]